MGECGLVLSYQVQLCLELNPEQRRSQQTVSPTLTSAEETPGQTKREKIVAMVASKCTSHFCTEISVRIWASEIQSEGSERTKGIIGSRGDFVDFFFVLHVSFDLFVMAGFL